MFLLEHVLTSIVVSVGGSWRRGGEKEPGERPREAERPREREREREPEGEKGGWRTDKDARRTKNETDDDGWTTVRR